MKDTEKEFSKKAETIRDYILLHLQPASEYWNDVNNITVRVEGETKIGGKIYPMIAYRYITLKDTNPSIFNDPPLRPNHP